LLRQRDQAELTASGRGALDELHREIQTGLDQLDRGEGIPGEQVLAEIRGRARR
jgi:hypothetical protein